MKTTFLIGFFTISLFLLGGLALAGCGDKNGEGDHDEHGDHMGHMNDVRAWLKKELGDKYDTPVPASDDARVAKGKTLYLANCATCHGESGKGDGPAAAALPMKPADHTDAEHARYYSDQGRLHIIRNGSPKTPMAGFKNSMSEEDIQAVFAYTRSLIDDEKKGGHDDDHDHDGHDDHDK